MSRISPDTQAWIDRLRSEERELGGYAAPSLAEAQFRGDRQPANQRAQTPSSTIPLLYAFDYTAVPKDPRDEPQGVENIAARRAKTLASLAYWSMVNAQPDQTVTSDERAAKLARGVAQQLASSLAEHEKDGDFARKLSMAAEQGKPLTQEQVEAERGLAQNHLTGADVWARIQAMQGQGLTDRQIDAVLDAGGWDANKLGAQRLRRFDEEARILEEVGRFTDARKLRLTKLDIIRRSGGVAAQLTDEDLRLAALRIGVAMPQGYGMAVSSSVANGILGTINAIKRYADVRPGDESSVLERIFPTSVELEGLAQGAAAQHPVASMAGGIAGGLFDPVFATLNFIPGLGLVGKGAREAFKARLIARGVSETVAAEAAAKMTLAQAGTEAATRWWQAAGITNPARAEVFGSLTYNAVLNAANGAGLAAFEAGSYEGATGGDVAKAAGMGALQGAVMGLALDGLWRGTRRVVGLTGGFMQRGAVKRLDDLAYYVRNNGDDAAVYKPKLEAFLVDATNTAYAKGKPLSVVDTVRLARKHGISFLNMPGRATLEREAAARGARRIRPEDSRSPFSAAAAATSGAPATAPTPSRATNRSSPDQLPATPGRPSTPPPTPPGGGPVPDTLPAIRPALPPRSIAGELPPPIVDSPDARERVREEIEARVASLSEYLAKDAEAAAKLGQGVKTKQQEIKLAGTREASAQGRFLERMGLAARLEEIEQVFGPEFAAEMRKLAPESIVGTGLDQGALEGMRGSARFHEELERTGANIARTSGFGDSEGWTKALVAAEDPIELYVADMLTQLEAEGGLPADPAELGAWVDEAALQIASEAVDTVYPTIDPEGSAAAKSFGQGYDLLTRAVAQRLYDHLNRVMPATDAEYAEYAEDAESLAAKFVELRRAGGDDTVDLESEIQDPFWQELAAAKASGDEKQIRKLIDEAAFKPFYQGIHESVPGESLENPVDHEDLAGARELANDLLRVVGLDLIPELTSTTAKRQETRAESEIQQSDPVVKSGRPYRYFEFDEVGGTVLPEDVEPPTFQTYDEGQKAVDAVLEELEAKYGERAVLNAPTITGRGAFASVESPETPISLEDLVRLRAAMVGREEVAKRDRAGLVEAVVSATPEGPASPELIRSVANQLYDHALTRERNQRGAMSDKAVLDHLREVYSTLEQRLQYRPEMQGDGHAFDEALEIVRSGDLGSYGSSPEPLLRQVVGMGKAIFGERAELAEGARQPGPVKPPPVLPTEPEPTPGSGSVDPRQQARADRTQTLIETMRRAGEAGKAIMRETHEARTKANRALVEAMRRELAKGRTLTYSTYTHHFKLTYPENVRFNETDGSVQFIRSRRRGKEEWVQTGETQLNQLRRQVGLEPFTPSDSPTKAKVGSLEMGELQDMLDRYQSFKATPQGDGVVLAMESGEHVVFLQDDAGIARELLRGEKSPLQGAKYEGSADYRALLIPKESLEIALSRLIKAGHRVAVIQPKTATAAPEAPMTLADVPDRARLLKPMGGRTGHKLVGYQWLTKQGEKWSNYEGGIVAARVSDWDKALVSEMTGRSIVHAFYIQDPDGRVTVQGRVAAAKLLGFGEDKLTSIAELEKVRQQNQRQAEDASEADVAKHAPSTATQAIEGWKRLHSFMPEAPYREAWGELRVLEKDGKFFAGLPSKTKPDASTYGVLAARGWKDVGGAAELIRQERVAARTQEPAAPQGNESGANRSTPGQKLPAAQVSKLRRVADDLQKQIDAKLDPAISNQNPTARRARIADSMRKDGQRLERVQQALRGIAEAGAAGTLDPILAKVDTKAVVEDLLTYKDFPAPGGNASSLKQWVKDVKDANGGRSPKGHADTLEAVSNRVRFAEPGTWIDVGADLAAKMKKVPGRIGALNIDLDRGVRAARAGIDSAEKWAQARAALEVVSKTQAPSRTPEQLQADRVKELERGLVGREKGIGIEYFPTPKLVAAGMLEQLSRGTESKPVRVLEPSAGKGDLLDAYRESEPNATFLAVEMSSELREILKAKGYEVSDVHDFMDLKPEDTGLFDRVIMNPPFSKAAEHVQHAFDFLAPGGEMVALADSGVQTRERRADREFREWLATKDAEIERLPDGSFTGKDAARQTGVSVVRITIHKPKKELAAPGRIEAPPVDGPVAPAMTQAERGKLLRELSEQHEAQMADETAGRMAVDVAAAEFRDLAVTKALGALILANEQGAVPESLANIGSLETLEALMMEPTIAKARDDDALADSLALDGIVDQKGFAKAKSDLMALLAAQDQPTLAAEAPKPKPAPAAEAAAPQFGSKFPKRPDMTGEVLSGKDTKIALADGRKLEAQYRIIESADLIPTHDAARDFAINPAGDANERPYHDPVAGKPSRQLVRKIAADLDPDQVLSSTTQAIDGPPITTSEYQVVGGNARSMALQLAYASTKHGAYTNALIERAAFFGFNPDRIRAMKAPILVRRLGVNESRGNRGELSRILNAGTQATKTEAADAAGRGQRLTAAAAERIGDLVGEDTLAAALNAPATAAKIMRELVESGAVLDSELAQFMTAGELNAAGKKMVEATMLGALVPDTRTLGELPPSLRQVLIRAAGPLMRMLKAAAAPESGLNMRQTLDHAIQAIASMRAAQLNSIGETVRQASLVPESWRDDGRAIWLAEYFTDNNPTAIAKKLKRMAMEMDDAGSGQVMLGASEPRTAGEIFDDFQRGDLSMAIPTSPGSPNPRPGGRTVPNWVKEVATTTRLGRVHREILADPEGRKVGIRSILQALAEDLNVMTLNRKEQTTAKYPATYNRRAHLIRSRYFASSLIFHEHGHAISALLRYTTDDKMAQTFLKHFGPQLDLIQSAPGSHASKPTPEEGFAEFIRLFIGDPAHAATLPGHDAMLAMIDRALPEVGKSLRDAARAMNAHLNRDYVAAWRSGIYDTRRRPSKFKSIIKRALIEGFSRGFAIDFAERRVYQAIMEGAENPVLGAAAAHKIRDALRHSGADLDSNFQMLKHVPTLIGIAIEGPGDVKPGQPTGLRVHATMWPGHEVDAKTGINGGDILDAESRQILKDGGLNVPAPAARHGDIVQFLPKSVRDILEPIEAADRMADFEVYYQMKASLADFDAKTNNFPTLKEAELIGQDPILRLRTAVAKFERDNPGGVNPLTKKPRLNYLAVFKELEDVSKALLVLNVASGELTATQAVTIAKSREHFGHLIRTTEFGPNPVRPGATTHPFGAPRRRHGSLNPAEPMLVAITRRVSEAVNAYYWNRLMLSPLMLAQQLRRSPDANWTARITASRIAIPLKLDRVKVATMRESELQEVIAEYLNEKIEAQDPAYAEIASRAKWDPFLGRHVVNPEDVQIVQAGLDIWRAKPPKAINIIAPVFQGERRFYQINDMDLYRLFSTTDATHPIFRGIDRIVSPVTQKWKELITQNIAFSVRNLFRDSGTAVQFGEGTKALAQGYFHTIGALSMVTGEQPDTLVKPELLSRVFQHHAIEDSIDLRNQHVKNFTDGMYVRGWRNMDWMDRALAMPGIVNAALLKPMEMFLVYTGQRWVANTVESSPRTGAYLAARARGLSDQAAQIHADTVTGNFGEKPLNPYVHAVYRWAGFINPATQITSQLIRQMLDPLPSKRHPAIRQFLTSWVARFAAIGLATAALWAIRELLSSEDTLALQAEHTEKERLTHMHLGRFRIPFDYGPAGAIQSMTWNALEGVAGRGRKSAATTLARSILSRLPMYRPSDALTLTPPSLKAAIESDVNYSTYTHDKIVPAGMEYAEPADQWFANTPMMYRKIGEWTGMSPIKIEHVLRNGFATQLDEWAKLGDAIDHGLTWQDLPETPWVGRLFAREPIGWQSASVQEVGELDAKYQAISFRFRKLQEAGEVDKEQSQAISDQLDKLRDAHGAMLRVSAMSRQVRDEIKSKEPGWRQRVRDLRVKMVKEAQATLAGYGMAYPAGVKPPEGAP